MINQKRAPAGAAIILVSLLIVSTLTNTAFANNKGLKVNVFISEASCLVGSNAEVRVEAGGQTLLRQVSIPAAESVVNFQFGPGEVDNGDQIFVSVTSNGQTERATGYNGEAKAPEDITVTWNCGSSFGFGSSSSSAASSSSSSSSSSSASKSCIAFC